MVLEKLSAGASRHMDEVTRKLVFLLCLPLVDGVFATLLVSGAIETFSNIVSVALTVFAGAGGLAVLYSYSETKEEARNMVLKAGPLLIAGAIAVSFVAPAYEQLVHLERIRYAAGLALTAIALQMIGVEVAEKFSIPGIVLTGLVLSVKTPSNLAISLEYVYPAAATSIVAVIGLLGASYLGDKVDIRYIRKGGSIVLGIIAASLFGLSIPSELGLAVLMTSVIFSLR